MADAKKIELELDCDGLTVVQTLGLSSVPEAEGAGLITEKIELLTGDYQLMSYTIYGAVKPGKDTPEELASAISFKARVVPSANRRNCKYPFPPAITASSSSEHAVTANKERKEKNK